MTKHALWVAAILASTQVAAAGGAKKLTKRFDIDGPTIIQRPCNISPDNCMTSKYAAGNVIGKQRFVRAPAGRLTFQTKLETEDAGPTWTGNAGAIPGGIMGPHGTYWFEVGVTVTSPSGQKIKTKSQQVILNGTTSKTIEFPVNVDWAESIVQFEISAAQEVCPKRTINQKLGKMVPECSSVTWKGVDAPNLAHMSLGHATTTEFPKDAFIVAVTPAAAFQSPVIPVGIVYAPLGNAGKASYTITQTTADAQTFTTTDGKTIASSSDDKTGYAANFSIGPSTDWLKVNGNGKETGTWDHSVEEDNGATYGETGSIITQRQIATSFSAAAVKDSLDKVGYSTQPFWNDLILASVNAQYALWDYPAGPVVQPLANASVVVLPIQQLDDCTNDSKAVEPSELAPAHWAAAHAYKKGMMLASADNNTLLVAMTAGTSGGAQPTWPARGGETVVDGGVTWANIDDHVISYAGAVKTGTTKYLWLTSTDCKNLASLDKFWVAKSQSAHPVAYRTISGGASVQTAGATTFSNTDQTQSTASATVTSTYAAKISATDTYTQADDFGLSLLSIIGADGGPTSSSQTSLVVSTTSSNQLQHTKTVTGAAQASTTIQDSYATAVPVNVVQDLTFGGIAVQDTNMHFTKPAQLMPATKATYTVTLPTKEQIAQTAQAMKTARAEAVKTHATRALAQP